MEIYHDFFKSNMLHDKLLWESTNLHSEKLLKNQLFEKKIYPTVRKGLSQKATEGTRTSLNGGKL